MGKGVKGYFKCITNGYTLTTFWKGYNELNRICQ